MASKKKAVKGKATSGAKKKATAQKPKLAKVRAERGVKKKVAKAQPKKKGKAVPEKHKPLALKNASSSKPSTSKKGAKKAVVSQKTPQKAPPLSAEKKKAGVLAVKGSARAKAESARGQSRPRKAKPERKSGVHEIPSKMQKIAEKPKVSQKKAAPGEPIAALADSSVMTPASHPTRKRRPEASVPSPKSKLMKNASAGEAKHESGGPQLAPNFRLRDEAGLEVDSSDLKGKPYVLYFYPKDDTPGCTREACDFRDSFGRFQSLGVPVFGVSPDSSQSHGKFAKKYELPFRLLSDPDKTLSSAYGAWAMKKNYGKEYMGVVRSTFLIAADGNVSKSWRHVKVEGHVAQVLAEVEQLGA